MPHHGPFQIETDPWGRLVFQGASGDRHVGIDVLRAFPLTDPDHWLIVVDAEGDELACIEDPATLPATLHQALREALSRRELVPILLRVLHVSTDASPSDWDVITDRGPTRFTLQSDDDLRRLDHDGLLIRDAQGMRYLIPRVARLDRDSRRWLDRHL